MTTQPPDLKKLREVRDWHRAEANRIRDQMARSGAPNWYEVGKHDQMADVLENLLDAYEASARDAEALRESRVVLESLVKEAEESAFESWIDRTSPSGDAESVHGQWKDSVDFVDFTDSWSSAIDAIEAARHATQGD